MQEETTRQSLYINELREIQLKYKDLKNCFYKDIIDNTLMIPDNMTFYDVKLFENRVQNDLNRFVRQSIDKHK